MKQNIYDIMILVSHLVELFSYLDYLETEYWWYERAWLKGLLIS